MSIFFLFISEYYDLSFRAKPAVACCEQGRAGGQAHQKFPVFISLFLALFQLVVPAGTGLQGGGGCLFLRGGGIG